MRSGALGRRSCAGNAFVELADFGTSSTAPADRRRFECRAAIASLELYQQAATARSNQARMRARWTAALFAGSYPSRCRPTPEPVRFRGERAVVTLHRRQIRRHQIRPGRTNRNPEHEQRRDARRGARLDPTDPDNELPAEIYRRRALSIRRPWLCVTGWIIDERSLRVASGTFARSARDAKLARLPPDLPAFSIDEHA